MDQLLYLQEDKRDDVLAFAIEKRSMCVMSRHDALGWRTYKSHLVSGDAQAGRLVITQPVDAADWAEVAAGERIGVTFRRGHKKCMFATTIHAGYSMVTEENQELLDVLEVQWPQQIHELQRRVYYRVSPVGSPIRVRFWRGGVAVRAEKDDRPTYWGMMQDLSAGGVRVLSTDVSRDDFVEGDVIGCSFTPRRRGEALILDAMFRHFQPEADGAASLGFQFVGLETTERGRQILARLARVVTDFHRAASQKHRHVVRRHDRS